MRCPICWDQFEQPMVTPCGHRFCKVCIMTALRLSKLECPTCRAEVSSHRLLRSADEEGGSVYLPVQVNHDSEASDPWDCPACTLSNPARRNRCNACTARRPITATPQLDVGMSANMATTVTEQRLVQTQTTWGVQVGDRVRANFRGWGAWYPGTVDKVFSDNTVGIAFDDGDLERRVSRGRVTKIAPASPLAPHAVHMKQYDDLKALVRTHDQQAAELARVKATAAAEIDAARADADAARAAVEAASEELTKLRDEVGGRVTKEGVPPKVSLRATATEGATGSGCGGDEKGEASEPTRRQPSSWRTQNQGSPPRTRGYNHGGRGGQCRVRGTAGRELTPEGNEASQDGNRSTPSARSWLPNMADGFELEMSYQTSTGYKGVSFKWDHGRLSKPYHARTSTVFLGCYSSAVEAAVAYARHMRKQREQSARTRRQLPIPAESILPPAAEANEVAEKAVEVAPKEVEHPMKPGAGQWSQIGSYEPSFCPGVSFPGCHHRSTAEGPSPQPVECLQSLQQYPEDVADTAMELATEPVAVVALAAMGAAVSEEALPPGWEAGVRLPGNGGIYSEPCEQRVDSREQARRALAVATCASSAADPSRKEADVPQSKPGWVDSGQSSSSSQLRSSAKRHRNEDDEEEEEEEHAHLYHLKTGRIRAGKAAPKRRNLAEWLEHNPGWVESHSVPLPAPGKRRHRPSVSSASRYRPRWREASAAPQLYDSIEWPGLWRTLRLSQQEEQWHEEVQPRQAQGMHELEDDAEVEGINTSAAAAIPPHPRRTLPPQSHATQEQPPPKKPLQGAAKASAAARAERLAAQGIKPLSASGQKGCLPPKKRGYTSEPPHLPELDAAPAEAGEASTVQLPPGQLRELRLLTQVAGSLATAVPFPDVAAQTTHRELRLPAALRMEPLSMELVPNPHSSSTVSAHLALAAAKSKRFKNCGTCKHCLDKPQFGGPGTMRRSCMAPIELSPDTSRPPSAPTACEQHATSPERMRFQDQCAMALTAAVPTIAELIGEEGSEEEADCMEHDEDGPEGVRCVLE